MNRIAIGPICPIGPIATYNQEHSMPNNPTKPKMSDDAVKAKTGKVWKEWFAILDKAGAKNMTHQEIVRYLREAKCRAVVVSNGYGHVRTANRETRAS